MHNCVYTFIPADGDIDFAVARALEPYDEEKTVAPYKIYLTAEEIVAMAKHYHLNPNQVSKLASLVPSWSGAIGGQDDRGLYHVSTFNPQGFWDWYEIGGRWDGLLPNNVANAQSLLEQADLAPLLPAKFVDRNGLWREQEKYVPVPWSKGRLITKSDGQWLADFRAALKAAPDSRVICVDLHS